MNADEQDTQDKDPHMALMVFSAPLVRDLASAQRRLPPTYVGVRRVRPSTPQVQSAWVGINTNQLQPTSNVVVYRIVDEMTGEERRMTRREKKVLKQKLRLEQQEAKKRAKREQQQQEEEEDEEEEEQQEEKLNTTSEVKTELSTTGNNEDSTNDRYHHLKINNASLEEELADLRGDRNGVPPVLLSPVMAAQFRLAGNQRPYYHLDDEYAKEWAASLKNQMSAAEEVRAADYMRPMAYQIVPEVWTRMRPMPFMPKHVDKNNALPVKQSPLASAGDVTDKAVSSFLQVSMRKQLHDLDSCKEIVFDLLYNYTELHISCGAKFGCDFLLYDGPRQERHAFAGLRICRGSAMPTPYDLAGYVRCLNTAGKLALLATVDYSTNGAPRVAMIDLALEKILSAPTHTKRKRRDKRREVGLNLAKEEKLSSQNL